MSRITLFVCFMLATISVAAPAYGKEARCRSVTGKESPKDLILSVNSNFRCALPLHGLRVAVRDPSVRAQFRAAFAKAKIDNPGEAEYVDEMSEQVDAAAGETAALFERYDLLVRAKPDNADAQNTACWVRGHFGVQLDVALSYCNAAIADYEKSGRVQPGAFANRAKVELLLGNFAAANQDYNRAINGYQAIASSTTGITSIMLECLYGRGMARLRQGDGGGNDDIRLAVGASPAVADDFADLGIKP